MKWTIAALVSLLLAGCIGARPADPVRYFVLDPAPAAPPAPYAGPHVIVAPATAADFYGNTQIVYSDTPGVRARYRFSFWAERPQQVIQAQLQARLQGEGGGSDLLLATHVDEIYHDASTRPGLVKVVVTVSLSDVNGDKPLARHRFVQTARAASYDAPGAVAAMRQAVGALLDEIVHWVQVQASLPGDRKYGSSAAGTPFWPGRRHWPLGQAPDRRACVALWSNTGLPCAFDNDLGWGICTASPTLGPIPGPGRPEPEEHFHE